MIFYRPRFTTLVIVNRVTNSTRTPKPRIGLFMPFINRISILSNRATTYKTKQTLMTNDKMVISVNISFMFKISNFEQIAILRTSKQRYEHYRKMMQAIIAYSNNYLSELGAKEVFAMNMIDIREEPLISELDKLGFELIRITFIANPEESVSVRF